MSLEETSIAKGRESEVQTWLRSLRKEIDAAEELLAEVSSRLASVVRNEPQSVEAKDDEVPLEELVPLASEIREATNRIANISSTYMVILSRLEL